MLGKIISSVRLAARCQSASRYAAKRGLPGLEFNRFGQHLGWRFLLGGRRQGVRYLITPVSNIRYFEFSFGLSVAPQRPGRWLDVSSPRLFPLFLAREHPDSDIEMINPDADDLQETRQAISLLRLTNVASEIGGVDILKHRSECYDFISCLSVVEHIAGTYGDTDAMRWMFRALKPGGRLLVTVPVDRKFWDEYRTENSYGTQATVPGNGYFFQHFYDERALMERLVRPLGVAVSQIEWYGETSCGHFREYIQRSIREGNHCTADDPREMADYYRAYPSYSEMPGFGVCGFAVEKPPVSQQVTKS